MGIFARSSAFNFDEGMKERVIEDAGHLVAPDRFADDARDESFHINERSRR